VTINNMLYIRRGGMMKPRNRIIAFMLALAMTLGFVSAHATGNATHELALNLEERTTGVGDCGMRWGLTISLGAATLSGCALLCGVAAWYSPLTLYDC
jgi:hypothetical protein